MKNIMFNDKDNLTKAVLEGRKTQTRRIVPESWLEDIEKFLSQLAYAIVDGEHHYEGSSAHGNPDEGNPRDDVHHILFLSSEKIAASDSVGEGVDGHDSRLRERATF